MIELQLREALEAVVNLQKVTGLPWSFSREGQYRVTIGDPLEAVVVIVLHPFSGGVLSAEFDIQFQSSSCCERNKALDAMWNAINAVEGLLMRAKEAVTAITESEVWT